MMTYLELMVNVMKGDEYTRLTAARTASSLGIRVGAEDR